MRNMKVNETHVGDCMELSKKLPDDYIDLVVTSPPYADTVSYGKDINVFINIYINITFGIYCHTGYLFETLN